MSFVSVSAAYALPRNVMQPLVGPFGTRKRPTLVPSGMDARIIACVGTRARTIPLPDVLIVCGPPPPFFVWT